MCRAPFNNGGFSLDEINWEMAEAAFFGYLDIVHLMLFRGANNYNTGLMTAASGGHLAMVAAADHGHIEIVRLMLSHGATDFNRAMGKAA